LPVSREEIGVGVFTAFDKPVEPEPGQASCVVADLDVWPDEAGVLADGSRGPVPAELTPASLRGVRALVHKNDRVITGRAAEPSPSTRQNPKASLA